MSKIPTNTPDADDLEFLRGFNLHTAEDDALLRLLSIRDKAIKNGNFVLLLDSYKAYPVSHLLECRRRLVESMECLRITAESIYVDVAKEQGLNEAEATVFKKTVEASEGYQLNFLMLSLDRVEEAVAQWVCDNLEGDEYDLYLMDLLNELQGFGTLYLNSYTKMMSYEALSEEAFVAIHEHRFLEAQKSMDALNPYDKHAFECVYSLELEHLCQDEKVFSDLANEAKAITKRDYKEYTIALSHAL